MTIRILLSDETLQKLVEQEISRILERKLEKILQTRRIEDQILGIIESFISRTLTDGHVETLIKEQILEFPRGQK